MPRTPKRQRKAEMLKGIDVRLVLAESDARLFAELFGDGVSAALLIMLDAPRRFIASQIAELSK